jgi:hypothetical protein
LWERLSSREHAALRQQTSRLACDELSRVEAAPTGQKCRAALSSTELAEVRGCLAKDTEGRHYSKGIIAESISCFVIGKKKTEHKTPKKCRWTKMILQHSRLRFT